MNYWLIPCLSICIISALIIIDIFYVFCEVGNRTDKRHGSFFSGNNNPTSNNLQLLTHSNLKKESQSLAAEDQLSGIA